MATLQSLVDRIQLDYLNKTNLTSECVRAIQAAIRFYEHDRFPWNETATAVTVVSSLGTVAAPSDFLYEDNRDGLRMSANGGVTSLIKSPFDLILDMNTTPCFNVPTHYALRGNNFHLGVLPDSAYPLMCYYVHKLPELTATSMTGTNDWLANAEDLLVYHAAKLVWSNVLRNTEEATKMYALERSAYTRLQNGNAQRMHSRLRPTSF